MIPQRKNGQVIDSSWFEALAEALSDNEQEYVIADGQAATSLSGQAPDGTIYSSVVYDYEAILGTTIFANGRLSLQYLNGTWRIANGGYDGEDHGLTFSVTQAGSVGQLKVASTVGYGAGTLKLKRRTFDA